MRARGVTTCRAMTDASLSRMLWSSRLGASTTLGVHIHGTEFSRGLLRSDRGGDVGTGHRCLSATLGWPLDVLFHEPTAPDHGGAAAAPSFANARAADGKYDPSPDEVRMR